MKLHRILFYLLLVLLPVQLGRHFWPDFAFVSGIRVDYLAPTVYLTDLLVIGILASWFWKEAGGWRLKIGNDAKRFWWVVAIFVYLLTTSLLTQNSGAALYKFIKIVEFTLLGFYVAKNSYQVSIIHFPFSIAITYSSLIALAQFIRQSSLNGIFWFLGERTFNLSTPGIARAVWGGQLILRPYATFPHPNVLAGFTLVSLILIATSSKRQATGRMFKWLAIGLGTTAIALSFSRSAWVIGILVCFWWAIRYLKVVKTVKKKLFIIHYSLFIILILGALSYWALNLSTEEAIVQRLDLNQAAFKMIKQKPVIGVGLNNFVPRLLDFWPKLTTTRFLQPVHNIFLLVAAETGLVGLVIFVWFLILTYKKLLISNNQPACRQDRLLITALSAILALGLFDHYFLTLQQTQLLFTIVLGLSWAKKKVK